MKIKIITNLYWLIIKGTHQNQESRVELPQLKFLTTVRNTSYIYITTANRVVQCNLDRPETWLEIFL